MVTCVNILIRKMCGNIIYKVLFGCLILFLLLDLNECSEGHRDNDNQVEQNNERNEVIVDETDDPPPAKGKVTC